MQSQVYYSNAEQALALPEIANRLAELRSVLDELPVPVYVGKSARQAGLDLVHPMLNALIEHWMVTLDWDTQSQVNHLTGGREEDTGSFDFSHKLPDGRYIALEIQFGNGGRIERDFYKLEQLHGQGLLALGVIVYLNRATGKTADSGLAEYEVAVSRKGLHKDMPLCILGLSRTGTPEVDLSVIPDIVFPSVMGGSGKGTEPLHLYIAQAVLDGKDLATLPMPKRLQAIIDAHAQAHVGKALHALDVDLKRVSAARNPALRAGLMSMFAEFFRSSYDVPQLHRLLKAHAIELAKEMAGLAPIEEPPVSDTRPAEAPPLSVGDATVAEASRYRVPKAVAALPARPVLRLVPPPTTARYPTEHFAMARAFSRAQARAG